MGKTEETRFFEQLCLQHYKRVFQYIKGKIQDDALCQDLVQNVFVIAFEKRKLLANHANPLGFLLVTARNVVLAQHRTSAKDPYPLSETFEQATKEQDLYEVIATEEDRFIDETLYIDRVLSALSPEAKALYEDYYVNHSSIKEIAKKDKVSEVSVRMRLVRLRKKVKSIVDKKGTIYWQEERYF